MILVIKKPQTMKATSIIDIVMTNNSPNRVNIHNLISDPPRKNKLRKQLLKVERNLKPMKSKIFATESRDLKSLPPFPSALTTMQLYHTKRSY